MSTNLRKAVEEVWSLKPAWAYVTGNVRVHVVLDEADAETICGLPTSDAREMVSPSHLFCRRCRAAMRTSAVSLGEVRGAIRKRAEEVRAEMQADSEASRRHPRHLRRVGELIAYHQMLSDIERLTEGLPLEPLA